MPLFLHRQESGFLMTRLIYGIILHDSLSSVYYVNNNMHQYDATPFLFTSQVHVNSNFSDKTIPKIYTLLDFEFILWALLYKLERATVIHHFCIIGWLPADKNQSEEQPQGGSGYLYFQYCFF